MQILKSSIVTAGLFWSERQSSSCRVAIPWPCEVYYGLRRPGLRNERVGGRQKSIFALAAGSRPCYEPLPDLFEMLLARSRPAQEVSRGQTIHPSLKARAAWLERSHLLPNESRPESILQTLRESLGWLSSVGENVSCLRLCHLGLLCTTLPKDLASRESTVKPPRAQHSSRLMRAEDLRTTYG